jgi:hypothetical protein
MQRERDMAIASDRYDVAVAAQVRSNMPRNLQGAAVAMFVISTGFIGTRFAHMYLRRGVFDFLQLMARRFVSGWKAYPSPLRSCPLAEY